MNRPIGLDELARRTIMFWRRTKQVTVEGDQGIIVIGKWSGRQRKGVGPLFTGKDRRTARRAFHNATDLGLNYQQISGNDTAKQTSFRNNWRRRDQCREENIKSEARSSEQQCSLIVFEPEAGGDNCRRSRNMEAEGSGSGRRWLRSGGPEDQSQRAADRKGKRKVEEEGRPKIQVFEISEEESEELAENQEAIAWKDRWRTLPGDGTEDAEDDQARSAGRGRGGSRGKGRGGKGCRGRGGRRRRDLAERRGRRGRQCSPSLEEEAEPAAGVGRRRTRQTIGNRVRVVEQEYREKSNPKIRRIMEHWEEEAIQAQSEEEMEEWIALMPDPGHTRGRMTLYKQSLHLYWVMKRLMAKALEQVALEMVEMVQSIPNVKKELKNIVITLLMQDKRLEDLHQQLEASGLLVKKEKAQQSEPEKH